MMTILHVTILRRISKSQGKAFCKELGGEEEAAEELGASLAVLSLSLPNRKLALLQFMFVE